MCIGFVQKSNKMGPHEAGVTDEEKGGGGTAADYINAGSNCSYGAWGFIFGLLFGILLGSIPLCFLKDQQRKKFYMIGWAIGSCISLIAIIAIRIIVK